MVGMLFSTSLLAIVTCANPGDRKKLQILNTKRQSTICELTFPTDILNVHLNRRRLVVVLSMAVYVYDISNMKLLHIIDTSVNPDGLCALASTSDECFMVYATCNEGTHETSGNTSPRTSSSVVVYNLHTLTMVNVVPAHRSRIACLALSPNGSVLATASEKGTIIRLFSVPDGRLLHQFRRGTYPAHIFSMAFNVAGTILSVTSDSDTIHLFRLPTYAASSDEPNRALERKRLASSASAVWRNRGTSMMKALGTYLPPSLAEMWEPTRDFAWLKLPHPGVRAVAVVSNTLPLVMVLTYEGILYTYSLDMEHGGECHLTQRTY